MIWRIFWGFLGFWNNSVLNKKRRNCQLTLFSSVVSRCLFAWRGKMVMLGHEKLDAEQAFILAVTLWELMNFVCEMEGRMRSVTPSEFSRFPVSSGLFSWVQFFTLARPHHVTFSWKFGRLEFSYRCMNVCECILFSCLWSKLYCLVLDVLAVWTGQIVGNHAAQVWRWENPVRFML